MGVARGKGMGFALVASRLWCKTVSPGVVSPEGTKLHSYTIHKSTQVVVKHRAVQVQA